MEVIRLQNETPEVYTLESRDFQLLCRAYDVLINSTKFDVDSMAKISDTSKIRANMLPLLQTKLGFFSNANSTANDLRLLLQAFPILIKKKGSLQSINEAINVYVKTLGLRIPFTIMKVTEEMKLYNLTITPHNVIIGLNTGFKNTSPLFKDLLKYILPAGFGCYLYFYSSIEEITEFIGKDSVYALYISDSLNSVLQGYSNYYSSYDNDDPEYRLSHAVSLAEIYKDGTQSESEDTLEFYS